MHRLSLILLCCFYTAAAYSQMARPSSEMKHSFSSDTALINLYIKKALPLALNPATTDSASFYLKKFFLFLFTIIITKASLNITG